MTPFFHHLVNIIFFGGFQKKLFTIIKDGNIHSIIFEGQILFDFFRPVNVYYLHWLYLSVFL